MASIHVIMDVAVEVAEFVDLEVVVIAIVVVQFVVTRRYGTI
jgi:hypothetical protein